VFGLRVWFGFWVKILGLGSCTKDLSPIQAYWPCHLTSPSNRILLMANNSSSALPYEA